MKEPVLVEIITYAPTVYAQCASCETALREVGKADRVRQEQLESSLPEDLRQEYIKISAWLEELMRSYGSRLTVKVIDAASVEGVVQSLRYGTRRFPAIILNRKSRISGGDALAKATEKIEFLMQEQPAPSS